LQGVVFFFAKEERVWGIFYFTFGFNIDIISYYKH